MKKKKSRTSKKRKTVSKADLPEGQGSNRTESVVERLVEVCGSLTLEEAAAAYEEAEGDENKAAEILRNLVTEECSAAEDQSTTSCSSTGNFASVSSLGSTRSSSSMGLEGSVPEDFVCGGVLGRKNRSRKVVASAGTVSTMLGKEYVRSASQRSSPKSRGFKDKIEGKEEMEQFLYSMLGDECDLSMAVVRDVFCQCAYDFEKALNILLELSSSSDKSQIVHGYGYNIDGSRTSLKMGDLLTDSTPHSISPSSESEAADNVWEMRRLNRNHFNTFAGTEAHRCRRPDDLEAEIPQKILEYLFKIPTPKSVEHDTRTLNWKTVVKKLSSLAKGCETNHGDSAPEEHFPAIGDEYHVFRQASKQHWESMRACYQKGGTAFSNGERDYASYISKQGRMHNKLAVEADERAGHDIFKVRNKSIENLITIDLHGQHVKQAMRLLKLHLLFGAYVRSVRLFRVITGCGSHGVGKSKLKQSVTDLLKKEGIQWKEENQGTLLIKLDDRSEFNFLDSDTEDD